MVSRAVLMNTNFEVWQDHMTDGLVTSITKEVLREKVLEDTTSVPFSTEVPVELAARPVRRSALTGFGVGAILTAVGVAAGSLMVDGCAAVTAVLAVWTLVEPMDALPAIAKVCGSVAVKADYFREFPEDTNPLPDSYGGPVRVQTLSARPYLQQA